MPAESDCRVENTVQAQGTLAGSARPAAFHRAYTPTHTPSHTPLGGGRRRSTRVGRASHIRFVCAMTSGAALPRLVLHFDVNETIMVGDPAGGDTFEQSLNKIVAKSAIVRRVPEAEQGGGRWREWSWHDGTPLDPAQRAAQGLTRPPPLLEDFEFSEAGSQLSRWSPTKSSAGPGCVPPCGCVSFYKAAELKGPYAGRFTDPDSPGVIYREVFEELERALQCDPSVDKRLCHDGQHHFLLPGFFHTLSALRDAGRSYSVVIRTFGTDGAQVVD